MSGSTDPGHTPIGLELERQRLAHRARRLAAARAALIERRALDEVRRQLDGAERPPGPPVQAQQRPARAGEHIAAR